MILLQRNSSLLNEPFLLFNFFKFKYVLVTYLIFVAGTFNCQIINYVNNPSFEDVLPTSSLTPYDVVKFWGPIDTNYNASYLFSKQLGTVPNALGYQYPKSGNNFIGCEFYCAQSTCPNLTRWYPRNRLKEFLKPGKSYCAKYYIVNTNNNVVGIDAFGMYFANSTLDTITHCSIPLTYLNPQIENQSGIITDTMNWIPITGTFVANGMEKYMLIGNFRSNAATSTLIINPTFLPSLGTDILIDDVSLIELDVGAFAGRDTSVAPGANVFLGRQPDVGIDEACVWYKLPGTVPIDTIAGFWVNPTTTSTYVVVQTICGLIKSDTVVVHVNLVGFEKLKMQNEELKIYPSPVTELLHIACESLKAEKLNCQVINAMGEAVLSGEIKFEGGNAKLNVSKLPQGIYFLQIQSEEGLLCKKLIIER